MSDISKIKVGETIYDIKDQVGREAFTNSKVTTLVSTADDEHIPTAKATYAYGQVIKNEIVGAMVTTIDDTSDDLHYPTAKAVYEYGLQSEVILDLDEIFGLVSEQGAICDALITDFLAGGDTPVQLALTEENFQDGQTTEQIYNVLLSALEKNKPIKLKCVATTVGILEFFIPATISYTLGMSMINACGYVDMIIDSSWVKINFQIGAGQDHFNFFGRISLLT